MSAAFNILLSLSCPGSLLILALLLCRPLFHRRLSKRWQYYIWLVVVARLLLPLAPEANLMGAVFQGIEARGLAQVDVLLPHHQDTPSLPLLQDDAGGTVPCGHGRTAQGYSAGEALSVPGGRNGAQSQGATAVGGLALGLCWLMGALILLIRKITIERGALIVQEK